VKLIGCRLPTKSAALFHLLQDALPASPRNEFLPLMASIHALTTQIKAMDKSIAQIADAFLMTLMGCFSNDSDGL